MIDSDFETKSTEHADPIFVLKASHSNAGAILQMWLGLNSQSPDLELARKAQSAFRNYNLQKKNR